MQGLLQDITRIIARRTITEPPGNAVSVGLTSLGAGSWFDGIGSWLGGLFRAEGGPVAAGQPYIVGERGPEWLCRLRASRCGPGLLQFLRGCTVLAGAGEAALADGIIVQINAALPPGLVQGRARALAGELTAAGIPASQAYAPASPGTKGGELLLGALLLEPVGKWTVETLLGRLRAFLLRDHSVKVTLKRPDGAEIAIEARNMDHAEVARWIEIARDGLR